MQKNQRNKKSSLLRRITELFVGAYLNNGGNN